jgi:hypothetical protein
MKKRFIVLTAIAVAVFALWSVGWMALAGLARGQIEALAEADGLDNPKLTCGTLAIGGYPFRLDVTCTSAALLAGDTDARLAELRLSALVYNPTHVLAFARGPLRLADAFTGSVRQLEWATLEASARTSWLRLARISIEATGVTVSDAVLEPVPLATIGAAELHLVDEPTRFDEATRRATLHLFQRFTDLTIPAAGIDEATGTTDAEISGVPDDITRFADADALSAWQQVGGAVTLLDLQASDPAASLSAQGQARLDDAGRLTGSFTVTSRGLVERYGAELDGPLRPAILGVPAEDGSYSQTITLNAGIAFTGIIPLGMIPPLF